MSGLAPMPGTNLLGSKGGQLDLGVVVGRVAIEGHPADLAQIISELSDRDRPERLTALRVELAGPPSVNRPTPPPAKSIPLLNN